MHETKDDNLNTIKNKYDSLNIFELLKKSKDLYDNMDVFDKNSETKLEPKHFSRAEELTYVKSLLKQKCIYYDPADV